MMSLDEDWNFMARWGVYTMAPSVFSKGCPKRTLYDVWASTTRETLYDGSNFGLVTFVEKGMQVDLSACVHSFTGESVNGLLIGDHSFRG